jgi:hypothetical protein
VHPPFSCIHCTVDNETACLLPTGSCWFCCHCTDSNNNNNLQQWRHIDHRGNVDSFPPPWLNPSRRSRTFPASLPACSPHPNRCVATDLKLISTNISPFGYRDYTGDNRCPSTPHWYQWEEVVSGAVHAVSLCVCARCVCMVRVGEGHRGPPCLDHSSLSKERVPKERGKSTPTCLIFSVVGPLVKALCRFWTNATTPCGRCPLSLSRNSPTPLAHGWRHSLQRWSLYSCHTKHGWVGCGSSWCGWCIWFDQRKVEEGGGVARGGGNGHCFFLPHTTLLRPPPLSLSSITGHPA